MYNIADKERLSGAERLISRANTANANTKVCIAALSRHGDSFIPFVRHACSCSCFNAHTTRCELRGLIHCFLGLDGSYRKNEHTRLSIGWGSRFSEIGEMTSKKGVSEHRELMMKTMNKWSG